MYVGVKNRLKEIRMREYMMSVSDFANLLQAKLSTYSRWENGDNYPALEKAFEISKILHKSINDIWFDD
jgi:putative transcriptional regulator